MTQVGHEYVCGFDVAVNDALAVGGIKGSGNIDGQVKHLLRG